MDLIGIETKKDDSGIVIKIPERDFGEFISSLLGQRRRVSGKVRARGFVAEREFIFGISDLLTQRLSQNPNTLVSFEGTVFYASGKSNTENSIEALRAFSDIRNEETIGITMKFAYLVQFKDVKTPERQDIFINFSSMKPSMRDTSRITRALLAPILNNPGIKFEIDNTNLTFGEDLYAHLTSYLEQSTIKDDVFTKFVLIFINPFIYATFIICAFGYTIFTEFYNARSLLDFLETSRKLSWKNHEIETIGSLSKHLQDVYNVLHKLLDVLAQQSVSIKTSEVRTFTFLLLYSIFTYFAILFCRFCFRSFTIMNKHTEDLHKRHLKRLEILKWTIVFGVVGGIATGLATNQIQKFFDTLLSK